MSLNEYNNRLKASAHRKNDEKLLLAHGALFNRHAQLTEKPDKNGTAMFQVQSLTELYDHETQRKLISGIIPDEIAIKASRQQKIMSDRQRAIEIEKKYARKEVEHGSE